MLSKNRWYLCIVLQASMKPINKKPSNCPLKAEECGNRTICMLTNHRERSACLQDIRSQLQIIQNNVDYLLNIKRRINNTKRQTSTMTSITPPVFRSYDSATAAVARKIANLLSPWFQSTNKTCTCNIEMSVSGPVRGTMSLSYNSIPWQIQGNRPTDPSNSQLTWASRLMKPLRSRHNRKHKLNIMCNLCFGQLIQGRIDDTRLVGPCSSTVSELQCSKWFRS